MALYTGTKIDLKVRGTDGLTRKIITDAGCTINLFAPSKSPQTNVLDRQSPDRVVTATFDQVSRYYIATVSTAGWTPGTWTMQGVLSGGANGYFAFDFETFELLP